MRPERRKGVVSRFSRETKSSSRDNNNDRSPVKVDLGDAKVKGSAAQLKSQVKVVVKKLDNPVANNKSLGSCFVCCNNLELRDKVNNDATGNELLKSIREFIFTPTFFWTLPSRNFSDSELMKMCYGCSTAILTLRKYSYQIKKIQSKMSFLVKKIQSELAKKYNLSEELIIPDSTPISSPMHNIEYGELPSTSDIPDKELEITHVGSKPDKETETSSDECKDKNTSMDVDGSSVIAESAASENSSCIAVENIKLEENTNDSGDVEIGMDDPNDPDFQNESDSDSDSDENIRRMIGEATSCCEICGRMLRTKSLPTHMKRVHQQIRNVSCNFPGCEKSFYHKNELLRHVDANHLEDDPTLPSTTCTQCGKLVKGGDRGYARHIRRVHERFRGTQCKVCNAKFTDNKSLNQHMRTHPEGFMCTTCKRTFSGKQALNLHLKGNACANRIVKLTKQQKINDSIVEEVDESNSVVKYYICKECDNGKKFSNLRNWKIHQKSYHEGERKHVCPICKHKFFRFSDLKRHEIVHVEVKPFSCKKCGRTFSYEKSLEKHKKNKICKLVKAARLKQEMGLTRKTKIRLYKCPLCDDTRSRKGNVMFHVKTSHNLTEDELTYYVDVVKNLPNLKATRTPPKKDAQEVPPQQIEISVVNVDADFLKNMINE